MDKFCQLRLGDNLASLLKFDLPKVSLWKIIAKANKILFAGFKSQDSFSIADDSPELDHDEFERVIARRE